jgi:hypothetical protein
VLQVGEGLLACIRRERGERHFRVDVGRGSGGHGQIPRGPFEVNRPQPPEPKLPTEPAMDGKTSSARGRTGHAIESDAFDEIQVA